MTSVVSKSSDAVVSFTTVGDLMVPTVNHFDDIYRSEIKAAIVAFCEANPFEDHVYAVGTPYSGEPGKESVKETTFCFAGGAILHHLLFTLHKYDKANRMPLKVSDMKWPKWSPSDTDCFSLGHKRLGHIHIGQVDVVRCAETTVEDLLLGFDLPCCRVATDGKLNWWFSIQFLRAIFTGIYYMPKYMQSFTHYTKNLGSYVDPDRSRFLFDRSQERIKKYGERGFTTTFIETDYIIGWMKRQCFYALSPGEKPSIDSIKALPKTVTKFKKLYEVRNKAKAEVEDRFRALLKTMPPEKLLELLSHA